MWIVWLEKKILKTLGILLGIIIILVTALHIYVVNNAEKLIEDLVDSRSNHKLKLKVSNIKFNYFSRKVELENVVFFSNDSLDLKTSYLFRVSNIKLKVKALLPIFTRKELLIDSIYLAAPQIEVTRLKPSDTAARKEVSIPEEMGRIYNSIIDALKTLQVTRFEFNEGKFTLLNKIHPAQQPLVITNLHFHADNFKIDTSTAEKKFLFSDQMVFRTRNQDILFPDGNHRLAFSRFRINIRRKLIEIDSCTISGKQSAGNRSAFSIFLDTLKLVNVDFKTLYENELIKADSVYCLNPDFKIHLEPKTKTTGKGKIPDLDTLIQQLTGDLLLNYVGVKNAGIDITTYRNNKPSSFKSEKNNFEMTGLSIDHSRPQPVSLQSFDMAIRNYENFLKDSSYFLRFDSIRLRENKISLSNFSINTEAYKDNRNIKVQQFVLSGLSWGDLLFERKIRAAQATLISPVIDYMQPEFAKQKTGSKKIPGLRGLDNIMSLEKIQVINGQIKIKTRNQVELMLSDANLTMNTRNIPDNLAVSLIEGVVEDLNFTKGIMKTSDFLVNMENAFYSGDLNRLLLDKINVYSPDQSFNITARKIGLDDVRYYDSAKSLIAAGIDWQEARVEINSFSGKEKKVNPAPLSVIINNTYIKNTLLNINSEKNTISVFLENLSARKLAKENKISAEELAVNGRDFSLSGQGKEITADLFAITDMAPSSATLVRFSQSKNNNSVHAIIPELSFTPDISSIIEKKPDLKNVKIKDPEIKIRTLTKTLAEAKPLPDLKIDSMEIEHPVFSLESTASGKMQTITWDGKKNKMFLQHARSAKESNSITIQSLSTDINGLQLNNSKGKTFSSKEITVKAVAENILLRPGSPLSWKAYIKEADVSGFHADSLGKKPAEITISGARLEKLNLGSEIISSLPALLENNPAFFIQQISGKIRDGKNNWLWNNFSYLNSTRTVSLDSFSFLPVMSRDAFVAASPFQTDYMTLRTGKIVIKDFDLNGYLKDSIFQMGNVQITNPYFTSYRDKRPPFNAGIIKPLAAKLIQKIPVKISIDTVLVQNGVAVYTELNDKTNETGTVPLTRISGDIFPIRNFNLSEKDSLRIRLNFYLLDSAWVRLRTRESYLDTLSGFLITLRMRPGSLMYLNPVLAPLASVKLQSGYLDTLTMRAVGREYLSLGEMKMFYHDLKVQFLRNGSESKKRFLNGLITFIANSFVIRNANSKRAGVVYFPRLRDRSFINYYIKIAMSGIASSIGAKKNKKLLRKYQRQIKLRQLPPIDFD